MCPLDAVRGGDRNWTRPAAAPGVGGLEQAGSRARCPGGSLTFFATLVAWFDFLSNPPDRAPGLEAIEYFNEMISCLLMFGWLCPHTPAAGDVRFYRRCTMPSPGKLPLEHAEGKGNDKMSVISKGNVSQRKPSEFRLLTVLKLVLELPCLSNPVLHEELLKFSKKGAVTFPDVLVALQELSGHMQLMTTLLDREDYLTYLSTAES